MKHTITILGAGSFGTAIAQLIAGNGYPVRLWDYDPEHIKLLKQDRENKKYLPGFKLDPKIELIADLSQAVCGVQWIFEAIPVAHLRAVLVQARSCATQDQVWVILSKGIEEKTNMFPTQMIDDVLGFAAKKAVFAGPSFAHEVARREITGVTIGATDCELGEHLQKILANEFFKPSFTTDMMGVQVGAAFKNVISLGIGMLEGAEYGENAKAFFLTLGLHEAGDFAVALGGKRETLYGFAGVGDLVLSSYGGAGRNFEFGRMIACPAKLAKPDGLDKRSGSVGESLQTSLMNGYTVEGLNTLKSVMALAAKYHVRAPVCEGIEAVIRGEKTVKQMMEGIMEIDFSECPSILRDERL